MCCVRRVRPLRLAACAVTALSLLKPVLQSPQDPVARRKMWNVITKVATERRVCSVILTTHR